MRETLISSTRALKQFQKGAESAGVITVAQHLGTIQTGTLRCTGKWKVDWILVKCLDDDDSRSWLAELDKWDNGGKFPVLRFSEVSGPPSDEQAKPDEETASESEGDDADSETEPASTDESEQEPSKKQDAESQGPSEPEENDPEALALLAAVAELNRKLRLLELRKEVNRKKRELAASESAEPETPSQEPGPGGGRQEPQEGYVDAFGRHSFFTLELIAKVDGQKVPFTEAVLMLGGEIFVVPGVEFFVGNEPGDGFGLAGVSGKWSTYYPKSPPESLGLDPGIGILVYEGNGGHAIDPHTLVAIFGSEWREFLYSAQLDDNDT